MNRLSIILASAAITLSGCSMLDTASSEQRQQIREKGLKDIEDAKQYAPTNDPLANIIEMDSFYVPKLKESEKDMPSWFFVEDSFIYNSMTLAKFNQRLQQLGVNARYLDGLDKTKAFTILMEDGTIGEALEKVKLATGFDYSISGDVITWSKFETAHLDISEVSGVADYTIGAKEGDNQQANQNNGFGGGMNRTIRTDSLGSDSSYANFSNGDESDVFAGIRKTIELLLSDEGQYQIDDSTNTLFVKDLPENVKSVRQFIKEKNRRLTAQVFLDIRIIDYAYEKSNRINFNLNVLKDELNGKGFVTAATEFSSSLFSTVSPLRLSYTREGGEYDGSQAVLDLLKQRGITHTQLTPSGLLRNNKITKIEIGSDRSYAASSTSSGLSNVGVQGSIVPGVINLGSQLYAIASINLEDDSITAKISNRYSVLDGEIPTFENASSSIQTPTVNKKDFFQDFYAKDGETIMLAGFGEETLSAQDNTAGTIALGGEKGSSDVVKNTIILVTPRIIKR
jgi:type IVB pilus formation R64 PilN family outer membrane protein